MPLLPCKVEGIIIRVVSNPIKDIRVVSLVLNLSLEVNFNLFQCRHIVPFDNQTTFWINCDDVIAVPNICPDQAPNEFKFIQLSHWVTDFILNTDSVNSFECVAIDLKDLVSSIRNIQNVVLAGWVVEVGHSPTFFRSCKHW